MKKQLNFTTIILILCIVVSSCSNGNNETNQKITKENKRYDKLLKDKISLFKPLPLQSINTDNPSSLDKINLGQHLYFDKSLSKNKNISCNSCHNVNTFGVDLLATSPGDKGEFGERNSPTVFNASFHTKQFWDGRAADIEEQAGGPILNPVEMNMDSKEMVINRIKKDTNYIKLFSKSFPEDKNPITYKNLTKAIGSYERELITPSRFDEYLNGKNDAITVKEKKGLLTFINVGCTNCHSGEIIGGDKFMKFGLFENYWEHTNSKIIDNGKEKITGNEYDKYVFKVPSLRNIAETKPYFHDGSVDSLSNAVEIMAKVQLNYTLSKNERENIVAFLNSLTADIPEKYKKNPFL